MILLMGVPTGARIGHVNSILSNAGNCAVLVILIALTDVILTGGVVLHDGALQPDGLKDGVKSVKHGLLTVV